MTGPLATIAYFAFRRPAHTRRSLESLAANTSAKHSRLFIYIDGPRNEDDARLSAEVAQIARAAQWCGSVEIVQRKQNVGCAASTIEVMSDLTERFDRVICLEDDNQLSRHFLDFMNHGLSRYAADERVMEITGYRFPLRGLPPVSGFVGTTVGWGWSTWRRAWAHFNPDGRDLRRRLEDNKAAERRFNMEGAFCGTDMLDAQIAGKIGGWDIRWSASCALLGGLTLYPARALSANIGHDGSGTNCGVTNHFSTVISDEPVNEFPNLAEENMDYRNALRHLLIAERGGPFRHLLRSAKRALLRQVKDA